MNIFITLDYELFLGNETGSVQNCLIRPMHELCNVTNKYNVPLTVFVDAAFLLRLYESRTLCPDLQRDWNEITHNLQEMSRQGHDIQLHFHPQWLFSTYNIKDNKWNMDLSHYKMSDIHDRGLLEDSFSKSKQLLETIIGERTLSFRAGGYCLEGIDYSSLFTNNSILIDSSVAREQYCDSNTHNYDYRHIPEKMVYGFSSDVHVEDDKKTFLELSISSIKWSMLKYLFYFRKIFKSYHPHIVYKDGKPIRDMGSANMFMKILNRLKGTTMLCSIDGPLSLFLEDYYNNALKKQKEDLVLIGHPKNASDCSIKALGKFIANHSNDMFLTSKAILN